MAYIPLHTYHIHWEEGLRNWQCIFVKCVLLNESPCSLCQEDLTIVNILLANVAEMSKKELRQNGCLEFRIKKKNPLVFTSCVEMSHPYKKSSTRSWLQALIQWHLLHSLSSYFKTHFQLPHPHFSPCWLGSLQVWNKI